MIQFENCEQFAKFYFEWIPFEYQKEPLNNEGKKLLIVAGRQSGKSDTVAMKAIYKAYARDNSNIFILAPTKQQSEIIITKIKGFINNSKQNFPQLRFTGNIIRDLATKIEFSNGSVIRNFTIADNADSIVGFTADIIIVDEASQIKDIAWARIMPMLAATNGQLICISTPRGVNNRFYEFYSKPEHGFQTWKWMSEWSPMITKEFLNGERLAKSEIEFSEEYEAEFIDVSDRPFPLKLIDHATNIDCPERIAPLPNASYYIGVDPSEGGDECVIMVLEDNSIYKTIVNISELYLQRKQELTIPKVMNTIKAYDKVWHPRKIYIDATGIGQAISQMLMNEGLDIEPFRISNRTVKSELFTNLQTQLENRTFLIPPYKKLRKSLLDMKKEYTESGDVKFSSRGHDDHATALALVALAFSKPTEEIIFSKTKSIW